MEILGGIIICILWALGGFLFGRNSLRMQVECDCGNTAPRRYVCTICKMS